MGDTDTDDESERGKEKNILGVQEWTFLVGYFFNGTTLLKVSFGLSP